MADNNETVNESLNPNYDGVYMNCTITPEDLVHMRCQNNMSGVKRLILIPHSTLYAIQSPNSAATSFDDYATLGSIGQNTPLLTVHHADDVMDVYSARDLGELKYTAQGSVLGNRSLKASLEVVHPSFKRKALGFFAASLNEEFVVLALLNNGEWHVLGDIDRGAQLADGAEGTSGKATTDQSGLTLTFEWDTMQPQVAFEGWSPDDATSGIDYVDTTPSN